MSWIEEAKAAGAEVAAGGTRLSETTVCADGTGRAAGGRASVSTEEVFGPVTCVYGFTDLDEAIGRANSLPVAFQSSDLHAPISRRRCAPPSGWTRRR